MRHDIQLHRARLRSQISLVGKDVGWFNPYLKQQSELFRPEYVERKPISKEKVFGHQANGSGSGVHPVDRNFEWSRGHKP